MDKAKQTHISIRNDANVQPQGIVVQTKLVMVEGEE